MGIKRLLPGKPLNEMVVGTSGGDDTTAGGDSATSFYNLNVGCAALFYIMCLHTLTRPGLFESRIRPAVRFRSWTHEEYLASLITANVIPQPKSLSTKPGMPQTQLVLQYFSSAFLSEVCATYVTPLNSASHSVRRS